MCVCVCVCVCRQVHLHPGSYLHLMCYSESIRRQKLSQDVPLERFIWVQLCQKSILPSSEIHFFPWTKRRIDKFTPFIHANAFKFTIVFTDRPWLATNKLAIRSNELFNQITCIHSCHEDIYLQSSHETKKIMNYFSSFVTICATR